jgi:hypothetical protein
VLPLFGRFEGLSASGAAVCGYGAVAVRTLGSLFGVVNHRDFGDGCLFNGIDNLFKTAGNIIAVRNFTALSANSGWDVFNNDNTVFHINGKGRISVLQCTFAHKTSHFVSSCRTLKSSDQSAGFGKYAVMSHNSIPFEPQTI